MTLIRQQGQSHDTLSVARSKRATTYPALFGRTQNLGCAHAIRARARSDRCAAHTHTHNGRERQGGVEKVEERDRITNRHRYALNLSTNTLSTMAKGQGYDG